jgi:hypothetical protein
VEEMKSKSSQYLKRLILKHQAFLKREAGVHVSMRELSEFGLKEGVGLRGDAQRLARWTSPTGRKSWRIPLDRIDKVIEMLGGSVEDSDRLMELRLLELEADDPSHPAVVSAGWALKQVVNPLSPDERRVLEAYRRVASQYPHGLSGQPEEEVTLERAFHMLLVANHDSTEETFVEDKSSSADVEAIRKRVMDALKAKGRAAPRVSRGEHRTTIRRLMLALRR